MGRGNKHLFATPISGKNSFKIFFSGTHGPMALGLGMQYAALGMCAQ